jgi:hypothetical protein
MKNYPEWICADCGRKHGRVDDGIATFHTGDACGWCGRDDVPVTEPRDYGYPKASTEKKGKA